MTVSFLMLLTAATLAQGRISGTVTYGDGSILHDASVQIVQLDRATKTNDAGEYQFDQVPAGRYTVQVHLEGFADATRTVVVGTTDVTADFQLVIASLKAEVTITASGTEQSVFDSFQSVTSVGAIGIAQKASTSLGEVLETESGVAKRSFGPGTARPVIRGFDGDRVLVLQDGVRVGSVGSQSGDHGEPVDALMAERIEVVKGPGTLLYGSNAIGGVVNVIGNDENDAHNGVRGFLTGVAGSVDRQGSFAAGIEYGIAKWVLRANSSNQRSGDYETPIGRIPNSAARSNSANFGAGYFGTKAFVNASFGLDVRRYGVPFAGLFEVETPPEQLSSLQAGGTDIDIRQRRRSFRLNGGFRDLKNAFISSLQYSLDLTDYRHKEIEIEDGIETAGTIFDNRTTSYRVHAEQAKHGRFSGRFGFEGFARKYEVQGAEQLIQGKVKHNSFSAFGLEELVFERVKFQFGGRVENNRYDPESTGLPDRSFTGFSGGAGINIGLWNGGSVVANYTFSTRAPALEELYNNGPHIGNLTFEIGNDQLRMERSNGVDLSLRHNSSRFRFTGDVYYYKIDNFVFLSRVDADGDGQVDTEDGLPIGHYTQGDARYVGVEINGDVTINPHFGAFAGFDAVRAELGSGDNVPRIPPARFRAGLEVRYGGLTLRPEAIVAADQDRTAPFETRTPGYGIINLGATYSIGQKHAAHIFTLNATNLTDRLYRNHLSFIKDFAPEPGRGIRFGYTVRFF
jgi:iron complex outermembrane receptor protein